MKTFVAGIVLAALALTLTPSISSAEEISIDSSKSGAIAYSPKTGKIGYAWNCGSRYNAEQLALKYCDVDDAKVMVWVTYGWAVLVIAEDGSYAAGYSYGDGSRSADAYEMALKELRGYTQARVAKVVVVCSGNVDPKVITP